MTSHLALSVSVNKMGRGDGERVIRLLGGVQFCVLCVMSVFLCLCARLYVDLGPFSPKFCNDIVAKLANWVAVPDLRITLYIKNSVPGDFVPICRVSRLARVPICEVPLYYSACSIGQNKMTRKLF